MEETCIDYATDVMWSVAPAKTEEPLERACPRVSVVLGHVGDIGEAVKATIPFERVSTTTYPNRRDIPINMMEKVMARRKRAVLELAHPNAAGIDRCLLDTVVRIAGVTRIHRLSRQCAAREERIGPQVRCP